ncbi:MAG TPA: sulfur carrier protein ThiS [Spirochaetales bacterium]|nr:sulfur carrier protein ThiS [Spirochaetales bacterium]MBP7262966.1 sulfur carrier protein ThiS [Spirochaetia bacterium]HPE35658.1 sulfur carrier protein ThiS [Spirochaetales bacterium]
MTILLNGDTTTLDARELTVRGVLAAKGWSFPLIIVQVNGTVIPRDSWDTAPVRDGDRMDALHLVSGG